QAEDGIRDRNVTGVQTCALPIFRYDYLMADKNDAFLTELCRYHISGQLKVAPEHISPNVLSRMGKPRREVYEAFVDRYNAVNRKIGRASCRENVYTAERGGQGKE